MSKGLSDRLGCFLPVRPYELKTADKRGRLLIIGYCRVDVEFECLEIPGGAIFEIAENLRDDIGLIIGRLQINEWDLTFMPEGPKFRRYPPTFEVV